MRMKDSILVCSLIMIYIAIILYLLIELKQTNLVVVTSNVILVGINIYYAWESHKYRKCRA